MRLYTAEVVAFHIPVYYLFSTQVDIDLFVVASHGDLVDLV